MKIIIVEFVVDINTFLSVNYIKNSVIIKK